MTQKFVYLDRGKGAFLLHKLLGRLQLALETLQFSFVIFLKSLHLSLCCFASERIIHNKYTTHRTPTSCDFAENNCAHLGDSSKLLSLRKTQSQSDTDLVLQSASWVLSLSALPCSSMFSRSSCAFCLVDASASLATCRSLDSSSWMCVACKHTLPCDFSARIS